MIDEDNNIGQPQPLPVQKEKKDKKRLILILLTILLIIALCGIGYLYWQLENNKQSLAQKEAENTALNKKLSDNSDKADKSEPTDATDDITGELPVVVFSPGGLFTNEEKTEITTKMINPYKAWQSDQGQSLVTLHVQQHSETPTQYTVDAIYQGGVYEGFLYGTVDAATQDWWHPECLDACTFTDTFRAAYPEVVR